MEERIKIKMDGLKFDHIDPIHSDERRTLTAIFNDEGFTSRQTKLLDISKGNILGKHYHDYKEMFYLLKGRANYTFVDVNTREKVEIKMKKGDRVIIEPYIAHKAEFIEDTTMIENTEQPYVSPEVNDKPWTEW